MFRLDRFKCWAVGHDWVVVENGFHMAAECTRCGENRGTVDYHGIGGRDFPEP